MVLLKNCKIVFNSDNGVLYSGTEARGYVHLTFLEPIQITELTIKLKGEKTSSWTENSGDDRRSYSGKESYFRVINNLLAASTVHNVATEFPVGGHQFYFSVVIPPEAATSFEGPHGKVSHTATVTLKSPGSFFDQTYKETLKVLQTCDLNLYPHLKDPLEVQQSKDFYTFFVNVGKMHVRAHVLQTGFVPGQIVSLKCKIHNESSVSNPKTKFFLKQQVIYKTTSVLDGKYRQFPDKTESTKIFSEMIAAGISKGVEQDYSVEIIIPHDLPPSSDPLVPTVLSIQYYAVVKVCVTGGHIDLQVPVPIQIGTVPLQAQNGYPMPNNFGQFGNEKCLDDYQMARSSMTKKE